MSDTEPIAIGLTAAEARLARYVVRDLIARRALARKPSTDELYALHDRLDSSVRGTKTCAPQRQSRPSTPAEFIDTTEAAAILNCSTSWVRRIRDELHGCRRGGRHLFPRQTVVEYAERKAGQHK